MADICTPIKTLFVADTTPLVGIAVLLTGGIRTYRELDHKGISRTTTPALYDDATKLMLPHVVIKQRGQIPTYELASQDSQFVTTTQILELWFYAHNDFAALSAARARAYALLQEKNIAGVGRVTLVNQIDDARAEEYNDAAMLRADFQVDSHKQV